MHQTYSLFSCFPALVLMLLLVVPIVTPAILNVILVDFLGSYNELLSHLVKCTVVCYLHGIYLCLS